MMLCNFTCRGRKKAPGGGGGRWVIVDTGDIDGPMPNALMYESQKSGDYHGEFCGDL